MRLVTLGVGAQGSPRYAPAGLLVAHAGIRVMIDGGPGADPPGQLDAWLVTDERAELIAAIRRLAAKKGLVPCAGSFRRDGLSVECRRVVHTNHPTYGYRIRAGNRTIVWAPEFSAFPRWARDADLMFAEGAGWAHPIRFAGGVGGHLDVQTVARVARRRGVRRLVFAHIGRPTLRALSRGERPLFGECAADGQLFVLPRRGGVPAGRASPGSSGALKRPGAPRHGRSALRSRRQLLRDANDTPSGTARRRAPRRP
jgi:hypothetical protein